MGLSDLEINGLKVHQPVPQMMCLADPHDACPVDEDIERTPATDKPNSTAAALLVEGRREGPGSLCLQPRVVQRSETVLASTQKHHTINGTTQ
ncbi:hypothetical protein E2C01_027248 [Portunus trituberculatus]|uniref:Uncharacterized protein n=1 Tax=Portunus trituberculatus TaxID=210409 RepID=A0A5B7EHP4_PORTR|nr:hypothetical protein [Portunus trituberculatus]